MDFVAQNKPQWRLNVHPRDGCRVKFGNEHVLICASDDRHKNKSTFLDLLR